MRRVQTAAEARQERRHPERRGAIFVERVTKRYGRTLALDAVSLAVEAGALFAVLGPNGAGKTTLMHILATIIKPDEGRALRPRASTSSPILAVRGAASASSSSSLASTTA